MIQTKAPQCCARKISRVRMDEADLRNLARTASFPRNAHRKPRFAQLIAEAKDALARSKQILADHQADEHSGEDS